MVPGTPQGEWTLLAALRALYERVPRRMLLVYVDEAGRDVTSLDVTGLVAETERIRGLLGDHGLRPGDRVALLYLPSLDFVSAFLGCLAAGVVPVPVAPPNPFRPGYDAEVLSAVVTGSGAAAVLTHDDYRSLVTPDDRWPAVPWVSTHPGATADAAAEVFDRWYEPGDLDQPVFLQYTSGSTGTPKGVMVSHRNIHHELIAIARDLGLGDETVAVTWVPHFHDLGLISFLLNTVVGHSARTYVLSPLTFLREPALWFEVISRVRATHTAAPNFAFDLVVRKTTPGQRARWDLRSLRVVGSSGELIRPATVRRFLDAFTPAGFPPHAFYPTYGMAEHTLSISMGGSGPLRVDAAAIEQGKAVPVPDHDGRPAVSYWACGWVTKPGARLRIVDPRTLAPCGPGQVGEIWVDSVTKARGYWGLPEETEATFGATVADGDPRRYLRTGDLGFLHEGELFVTGRFKDLIIIRGHNHYPQDIEDGLRHAHPAIRPGGVAAFSVPAPQDEAAGERLIVFAETNGDAPSPAEAAEIVRVVRGTVRRNHGVAAEVVLGPRGLVLKTTSGKLRRAACREAYLKGEAAAWPAGLREGEA